MKKSGKIYLVGAGPGDPGLMTVRGAQLISRADVIVMDALVNPVVVENARGRVIHAGKRGRSRIAPGHGPNQKEINALLLRLARQGHNVVRLKGGDPFVFGRGSEEIEVLRREGIPYEVVSGVSSAVAAPAYAGIPVTDRRWASQVTFLTGHETTEEREQGGVDWRRLSPSGSLVILMGVTAWPDVVHRLLENGWTRNTPVAAIERATTARQRVIRSRLAASPRDFVRAGLSAPAVIIVGAVAGLSNRLDWFAQERPLVGRRIVVTRASGQTAGLADLLREEGATVVSCPLIEVRTVASSEMASLLRDRPRVHGIVFLSANAVRHFTAAVGDTTWLSRARVVAVGPQTADAARAAGWRVSSVPSRFDAKGVRKIMGRVRGQSWLLPRGLGAPDALARSLARAGAIVRTIPVYETLIVSPSSEQKRDVLSGVEAVTFMSASSVSSFFRNFSASERRRILHGATIVSIGPTTTASLRKAGVRNVVQAPAATRDGVIDVLRRHFRSK